MTLCREYPEYSIRLFASYFQWFKEGKKANIANVNYCISLYFTSHFSVCLKLFVIKSSPGGVLGDPQKH